MAASPNELPRPRCHVFVGLSLDGRIAGAGGDLSWLSVCGAESTAETGYDALMQRVDTLLIGRRTYDTVAAFGEWPFHGKRVRVLTHRPLQGSHGEQARSGDLALVLEQLHAEGAQEIYLDGGEVVRQALALGCVDELTLSWVPVLLGEGTPLFTDGLPRSDWLLTRTRGFASGMVQASYVRRHGQDLGQTPDRNGA